MNIMWFKLLGLPSSLSLVRWMLSRMSHSSTEGIDNTYLDERSANYTAPDFVPIQPKLRPLIMLVLLTPYSFGTIRICHTCSITSTASVIRCASLILSKTLHTCTCARRLLKFFIHKTRAGLGLVSEFSRSGIST